MPSVSVLAWATGAPVFLSEDALARATALLMGGGLPAVASSSLSYALAGTPSAVTTFLCVRVRCAPALARHSGLPCKH